MSATDFVHLHNHSEFSLLDGAGKVDAYFAKAAQLGQSAIGITDHGTLSGVYRAFQAEKKYGVKAILGCEFYIAPEDRRGRTPVEGFSGSGKYAHITVLAKNSTGLRNIYSLQAQAHTEGFYQKPRIDFDILEERKDGLIVLSGCPGGHLATYLLTGRDRNARDLIQRLAKSFGEDFYLEVMMHGIKEPDLDEEWLNDATIQLSNELSVPPVATNDAHYCNKEDSELHSALLCVQTRDVLSNPDRFKFNGSGFYLKSRTEMEALGLPVAALDATVEIAEKVTEYNDVFESGLKMPKLMGALR